ncbi:hypothetical protein ACWDYH_12625 [Nocardia goodfellowii]
MPAVGGGVGGGTTSFTVVGTAIGVLDALVVGAWVAIGATGTDDGAVGVAGLSRSPPLITPRSNKKASKPPPIPAKILRFFFFAAR